MKKKTGKESALKRRGGLSAISVFDLGTRVRGCVCAFARFQQEGVNAGAGAGFMVMAINASRLDPVKNRQVRRLNE